MSGGIAARYGAFVASRSKLVLLVALLATALIGAGAVVTETEDAGIGEFEVESPETEASDEIAASYGAEDGVVAQLVVRERGGDVLTKDSLLAGLELQQEIRDRESLARTLDDPGLFGIENVVAAAAVRQQRAATGEGDVTDPPSGGETAGADAAELPPLDEQYAALDALSEAEVEALLQRVLDPDRENPGAAGALELLPTSYEPGTATAESRLTLITQVDTGDGEEPTEAYEAQVDIAALADERFADAFVFGQGINDDASSRAVGDSFAIITPVALVLVLFILAVTYRDVLDVVIAFVGIGAVMAWLAGLMGWLGIPSSQLLIAVPFLLIGLSIDYALHVVMRYRESRDDGGEAGRTGAAGVRRGMSLGLGGVVLALGAATFSTGVGFLSNVVSPLPAIQDFALLSAGGILATFLVFGALVPALKIEVDAFVEERLGRSRRKPAFGVSAGPANGVLSALATAASRAPLVIVAVALLLSAGGLVGATDIDTEFNEADFLPQDPPEWTASLPGPLEPGSYTIADDLAYLSENFQLRGPDERAEILIRGNVTDGQLLSTLDDVSTGVGAESAISRRADGVAAVEGPHTVLRAIAADNATVAAAIDERDESGNGLPDEGVGAVYDLAFGADEQRVATVLNRTGDGEYGSARLLVGVRGDASAQRVATDTREFADRIEEGAPVTAVATGGPVTTAVIQDALLETLIEAFAVTLVVITVFLVALYWQRHRAPTLGLVALAPVLVALACLLGAMALLGISFNSETAVITSLAIGLGVDYSIHASERFVTERDRRGSLAESLRATLTGTGGALLASAATTATGFGVLALALAPPLRRFGIVTGVSIVFALLACLTLLPALLVLRERLIQRLG
jgi:predicted RND superfamily exporter protein